MPLGRSVLLGGGIVVDLDLLLLALIVQPHFFGPKTLFPP